MGTGFDIGFGFHGMGMLIFWGVILLFVILLGVGLKTMQSTRDDSAMKILENRLARGEINPKDYDLKKRILNR